jgi:hypothetical protein
VDGYGAEGHGRQPPATGDHAQGRRASPTQRRQARVAAKFSGEGRALQPERPEPVCALPGRTRQLGRYGAPRLHACAGADAPSASDSSPLRVRGGRSSLSLSAPLLLCVRRNASTLCVRISDSTAGQSPPPPLPLRVRRSRSATDVHPPFTRPTSARARSPHAVLHSAHRALGKMRPR